MLKRELKTKNNLLYGLLCLLVLVVFTMIFLYKSSHRRIPHNFTSEYVRAGGDTLNIAIELNPAHYMVKGDSIMGRDYEMLQQISQRFGVPMKFYPFVPLKRAIDGLDRGEFDMIVASMPLTTKLKERYLMTDPVYLDREILVQRIDSLNPPIKSQYELGGDTVWIAADSPFISRLENLSDEIGDTIYIKSSPEYSSEALMILTARGVIQHAVVNEGIAREMAPKFPNLDVNTPISFTQFQSWALRSDSVLLDSINTWLSRLSRIK